LENQPGIFLCADYFVGTSLVFWGFFFWEVLSAVVIGDHWVIKLKIASVKLDVQQFVDYVAHTHAEALLQMDHVLILQASKAKLLQISRQLLYSLFNVSSEISEVYENAKFFDLFCKVKSLKELTFSLLSDISQ
jgi:hypothetical protein